MLSPDIRSDSYSVLFICKANRMRSPAAEIIAGEKTKGSGLAFSSAGLIEPREQYTSPEMIQALGEIRYHPRMKTTSVLNADIICSSDLVLCFEDSQVNSVSATYPPQEFEYRLDTIHNFASAKPVRDPDGLIGRHLFYVVYQNLPLRVRKLAYWLSGGFVDNRDLEGVTDLCKTTACQIEHLVDLTLDRLKSEGKF